MITLPTDIIFLPIIEDGRIVGHEPVRIDSAEAILEAAEIGPHGVN